MLTDSLKPEHASLDGEHVSLSNKSGYPNSQISSFPTTSVLMDRLTLLRSYPEHSLDTIIDKATNAIELGNWYQMLPPAKCKHRFRMFLPDQDGAVSAETADLRFGTRVNAAGVPLPFVRVEWNPARAGGHGTDYLIHELGTFLPEPIGAFLSQARIMRIDFALDVGGIRCSDLVAERTTHHKRAAVYAGANGEVNSLRIGARRTSSQPGLLLRLYTKQLDGSIGGSGVRAEIEYTNAGTLASLADGVNPFSRFRIYQFAPSVNQGVIGCFISAAREKGVKRAMSMLLKDEHTPPQLPSLLAQSLAVWWEPDQLWHSAIQALAQDQPLAKAA